MKNANMLMAIVAAAASAGSMFTQGFKTAAMRGYEPETNGTHGRSKKYGSNAKTKRSAVKARNQRRHKLACR